MAYIIRSYTKARRRELVNRYNQAFAELAWLTCPYEAPGLDSCFHLYVVQLDFDAIGLSRAEVMARLKAAGIGSQVHYIPVPEQPWYRQHLHTRGEDYPQMQAYYQRCLSLPLFAALSDEQQQRVIQAVRELV